MLISILIIFLSCASLSVFLEEIGFFEYVAQAAVRKFGSNQNKLFLTFSLVVALLTIITSNDILILTFTPFICHFARHAKISATPYIVSEFVMANVWSMFFLIGNPTNIYLGMKYNISFLEYASNMFLPTIMAGLTAFVITYLLFRRRLEVPIKARIEERCKKPNSALLVIGLLGLGVTIVLMAIASYINLELWIIPLVCAFITYLMAFLYLVFAEGRKKIILEALGKLPYIVVPFLLVMALFVMFLGRLGVVDSLANFIKEGGVFFTGSLAFISGNILNNIPMTMFFADILGKIADPGLLIYSVVIASNICAFLTPIGSLSGIMFMKILKRNKVDFSFKEFITYGAVIAVPTLLAALLVIQL